jgi:hypothetical protein
MKLSHGEGILDRLYFIHQHNTYDVQLLKFYIIRYILHVSTIFLVIISYNMNTLQVVNYIGHNTDPYWLTNCCAVEILLMNYD